MRRIRTILLTVCVIILLLIALFLLFNDMGQSIPTVVYTTGIS